MRNRKQYRKGPNIAEYSFETLADELKVGWHRRGYPDYMLIENDEIVGFVEVKPFQNDQLRKGQDRFKRLCEKYKIPFFKWSPDDPFPYKRTI